MGRRQHGLDMVMLSCTVIRLVIEPVIDGQAGRAITPEQRHEVNPLHDSMMRAGPQTMDQADVLSIRVVQRGVIDNQDPSVAVDMLLHFVPPWRGSQGSTDQARASTHRGPPAVGAVVGPVLPPCN